MSHVSSLNGLTGNLNVEDIGFAAGLTVAAGTTTALSADVTADTQRRLIIRGDGLHLWGSGSATGDTNLYRDSANVLKTDDALVVAGTLGVTGATTLSSTLGVTGAATLSSTLASGALTVTGAASASTTVTAGTGITATTGNIAASSGNVTASGGVTGGTGVTATTGDITATAGSFVAGTAGQGLEVKTGSNARIGTLTLNGATPVPVSTTAVTADSAIFLTVKTVGGTPAFSWVSDRTPATSFTVTGTASDTSVLNWFIVEPIA